MNESLKERILRRLEQLPDERAWQVLDYIEFLESRYAERSRGGGIIARITETAEDTMRAAGVPLKAISGTMGLVDSAGKVMKGVAAAAQSVVEEAVKAASPPPGSSAPAAQAGVVPPAGPTVRRDGPNPN